MGLSTFKQEEDQNRSDELKHVLIIERKRYCFLMNNWLNIIQTKIELGQIMLSIRDKMKKI